MDTGVKIKRLRELRNFTQEYMAAQLNMSQTGYSKIESGATSVSLVRLEQIAKVLDVELNEILTFDEKIVFSNSTQYNRGKGLVL